LVSNRLAALEDLDAEVDYTDLTDDKVLSVERERLRTTYSNEKLGYWPGKPSTDRRCVREPLRRENVQH
jgi:hypothetical protein